MNPWKISTVVIGIVIVLMVIAIGINMSNSQVKEHEKAINESWTEGLIYGWNLHLQGIIEMLERDGVAILKLNEDIEIVAFSQNGCIAQIEYEGCEVVCAGRQHS